jgi:hypothetical protein
LHTRAAAGPASLHLLTFYSDCYREDKFGKAHASKVLPVHNGANVFIRLQANRKGCVEHQITKAGKVVCSVMNPSGGGNHNIQVIVDGVKPQVGNQNSALQYDTCCCRAASCQVRFCTIFTHLQPAADARSMMQKPQDAWVGYIFTSEHKFSKLVFQVTHLKPCNRI